MTAYLQSGDYAAYGIPAGTADSYAIQASALIDAYIRRPEGLVWIPDANGMPCYMAALKPSYVCALQTAISPGVNVQATLTGAYGMLQPGDVLIADRETSNKTEALTIVSVNGNTAIFDQVQIAHGVSTTLDAGMVIEEQRYVPSGRPLTIMSRTPLVRVVSGVGRYGYGRRGDGSNYNMEQFNLLAAVSKFGGPPAWERFSPLNTGWDQQTGQVWIPAGVMLAYYSEVKLRYVAGFNAAALPDAVKAACAQIIKALLTQPPMGNIKKYQAGDTAIENFSASMMSEDTKRGLDPFAARVFA